MLTGMHIWRRHYWHSLTNSSTQLWKSYHFSPSPLLHSWSPGAVQSCNSCSAHERRESMHLPSTSCWQKWQRAAKDREWAFLVLYVWECRTDALNAEQCISTTLQEEETIAKVGVTLPIPSLSENSSAQAEWKYITQDQAVRKPEQAVWSSQRRDVTSFSLWKTQTSSQRPWWVSMKSCLPATIKQPQTAREVE